MIKKIAKTIRSYASQILFNDEVDKYLCKKEEFDFEGNLIELSIYDIEGQMESQEKFTFSGKNVIKKEFFDHISKSHIMTEIQYQDDLIILIRETYDGAYSTVTHQRYNSVNRIQSIEKLDDSNELVNRVEFSYDGNLVTEKAYDEENILFSNSRYYESPDDKYNKGEYSSVYLDFDDRESSYIEEYDSLGNQIKWQYFPSVDLLGTECKMEYNQNNDVVKAVQNEILDDYVLEYNIKYNDRNKEVLTEIFKEGEFYYSHETEFNLNGDAVKEITKEAAPEDDFIQIDILSKEIEYYD